MGQQETTMTVAEEEKGGGTLRRMFLVLLVAALMAAMMAVSALPAFASAAQCQGNGCAFGRNISRMATGEVTGGTFNPGSDSGGHSKNFGTSFPPGQHR
jgi:hypothetical protein